MQQWVTKHAYPLTKETTAWLAKLGWPDHKPAAMVTLDDRAVTFDGIFPDPEVLIFFRPWNK